jgi:hypothetical protein
MKYPQHTVTEIDDRVNDSGILELDLDTHKAGFTSQSPKASVANKDYQDCYSYTLTAIYRIHRSSLKRHPSSSYPTDIGVVELVSS